MKYLAILIVAACFAIVSSESSETIDLEADWNSFKVEHDKEYENSKIEELRKTIYMRNKRLVDDFNQHESEELGFTMELNHLADMTEHELQAINGYRGDLSHSLKNSPEAERFLRSILENNSTQVPDSIDWRDVAGRVSRVKNQGSCGSCWAFASTGALEGQEKVRHTYRASPSSDIVELSEQNLVDCVKKDYGCNGGLMADAFDYIKEEGGIDSEEQYPYEARTRKCRFRKDKSVFSDSGSSILPVGDEKTLKEVVAKFGPVAVAIDASSMWFQFYKHGVYVNKHCHNKQAELDHGVLVVGYGTDPKKGDYWIVKNSWGEKYGESGYIRMARNRNNMCGIATSATIPTF